MHQTHGAPARTATARFCQCKRYIACILIFVKQKKRFFLTASAVARLAATARHHRERLSLLSSGETPWLSVSQDGVEDDDELADAGGERLFGGFSVGSEF